MAGKKQYYKLDDIGIVGVQTKASKVQLRKEMERTSQHFKTYKATACKAMGVTRHARPVKSAKAK